MGAVGGDLFCPGGGEWDTGSADAGDDCPFSGDSVPAVAGCGHGTHVAGIALAGNPYATVLPATAVGIEKYLGSGLIKGVGPVTAKRIVKHFGLETLDVIEASPARLIDVPGCADGLILKVLMNAELDEAIVVALGKFRLKAAEPLLVKMLQSKFSNVRRAAAWALGEIDI